MMKILLLLSMLVFPAQAFLPSVLLSNLIDQTCKQTPFYGLCVATLLSNPKSYNADVKGLARIMIVSVDSKASDTLEYINRLLEQRRIDSADKEALAVCAELYDVIIKVDVSQAMRSLDAGDYKYAAQGTIDAAVEANTCEREFDDSDSPLTKKNKLVHDLSIVAASIVKIVIKS